MRNVPKNAEGKQQVFMDFHSYCPSYPTLSRPYDAYLFDCDEYGLLHPW